MQTLLFIQLLCLVLAAGSLLWAFRERRRHLQASKVATMARQQAEDAIQARWDYERALGLPFYNEQQTEDTLFSRASEGDSVAALVLQERMARSLTEAVGEAVEKPAARGRALI
jgi:hypothetical protein